MSRRSLLVVFVLLGIAGCLHNPPQPTPDPPKYTVGVHVYYGPQAQDRKVAGALVRWDDDRDTSDRNGVTDGAGNFWLPARTPYGFNVCAALPPYYPDVCAQVNLTSDVDVHLELYSQYPKRTGLVRFAGNAATDDGGPFNAWGASLFWAAWAARSDEPKLRANLEPLAVAGAHFVRWFAQVGCQQADGMSCGEWMPGGTDRIVLSRRTQPRTEYDYADRPSDRTPRARSGDGRRRNWWWERSVLPRSAGYVDQIRKTIDLAYDEYGIRSEVTIFGGIDDTYRLGGDAEAYRVIDRVLEAIRGREHKVWLLQLGNEIWQTGLDVWEPAGQAKAQEYARYIMARTSVPFSISDTQGEDWCSYTVPLNAPLLPTIVASYHPPRDGENGWRQIRMAWETCDLPLNHIDEPDGPDLYRGSNPNMDPYRVASAAITGYLTGNLGYVYHTLAGTWGGAERRWEGWDRPANLSEHDPRYLQALGAMHEYLPQGLASWDRWHIGQTSRPAVPFSSLTGTPGYGAVDLRAYGASNGNEFVVNPIGVGQFVFTVKDSTQIDVIDPMTGERLQRIDVPAGGSFVLEGKPTYVLHGMRGGTLPN